MSAHENTGNDGRERLDEVFRAIARRHAGEGKVRPLCGHAGSEEALLAVLWDFMDGVLGPEEEEAVEMRLESCACCARCYSEAMLARESFPDPPVQPVKETGARVGAAARFVLQIVRDGIEALSFPGQLVPAAVPSRGPKQGGWRGGFQVEYELSGRKLTLVANPTGEDACRVQLVGRRGEGDFGALVAELHRAGRRICFQPFRESPDGFIWESDRIRPGDYRLLLREGDTLLGEVDVTVLGPEDRCGGEAKGDES